MTTGMLIDGIFASEAIDSSGEILDVEGCDISDFEEGRGLANWEHRGDDAPGASGLDIVGKIAFGKKIFSAKDCDDDRQRAYWDKVQLPFIYGIVRLYDGAGHEGAKALAAQVRDHVANAEPVLVRFSIEGSTLEKDGNRLKRCVARRVALTVKPCNRTCDSGLIEDPHAPEGFEKKPDKNAKGVLADIIEARKSEHPMYAKLGGSTEIETSLHTQKELVKSLVKAKLKAVLLKKALTAGSTGAAPSTLTGGAALQREDDGLRRKKLLSTAKAALRDYQATEHGDFKAYLKHQMPEAADEFISHFADLVDDYKAKLKKAHDDEHETTNDIWGRQDNATPQGESYDDDLSGHPEFPPKEAGDVTEAAPKGKSPRAGKSPKKLPKGQTAPSDSSVVDDDPDAAMAFDPKAGITFRGQKLNPNPEINRGDYSFDEHLGELKTPQGTLRLYNPDEDTFKDKNGKTAGELFKEVWHSPAVRKQHDYAVRNWIKINKSLKAGKLPEAVLATSVAFSQLSPNTPVPVHEMMYAYLLDATKKQGYDLRDHRFGDGFEDLYQKARELKPATPVWHPTHMVADAKGVLKEKRKKLEEMLPEEKTRHLADAERYERELAPLLPERKKMLMSHPGFREWASRDTPQGFPESSMPYFRDEIPGLITSANDSNTGRKAGDRMAFMLAANKYRNMATYRDLHKSLVALVAKHGVDGRSAVTELMNNKREHKNWANRRDNFQAKPENAGKEYHEPAPLVVPGLAPKTARFAYSMLGGGNTFVPDTHFSRHLFGLDKAKDSNTIALVRDGIMWNESNSDVLGAMDRWYYRNHPAVKYLLNHPDSDIRDHFRANPEQAVFPAFWGHWLSIAPHEQALGHAKAKQASNQSASHRPIFEENERLLNDPVESKTVIPARTTPVVESPRDAPAQQIQHYRGGKLRDLDAEAAKLAPQHSKATAGIGRIEGQRHNSAVAAGLVKKSESVPGGSLIHPVHAAYLLKDWSDRLGPAQALFRYYTHLVPLLVPDHHGDLDQLDTHEWVRKAESMSVELLKAAGSLAKSDVSSSPPIVDASKHEHEKFPMDEAQKKLVHGMNLNAVVSEEHERPEHTIDHHHDYSSRWRKTADGSLAYVKAAKPTDDSWNEPRREAAYFHAARDFFGLGHYLPTTALVKHPTAGTDVSVQAAVKGAEHAGFRGLEEPHHADIVSGLGRSGELDKIAIMNYAMGNGDRHHMNFMYTKEEKPGIKLIDHGGALWGEHNIEPDYFKHYKAAGGDAHEEPVHPEAVKWALGLDPTDFHDRLLQMSAPPTIAHKAAARLTEVQDRLRGSPNANRRQAYLGDFENLWS